MIFAGSTGSASNYEVTAHPVELASGEVKVGNITFDPSKVLGRGCEGTFVYQVRWNNFLEIKSEMNFQRKNIYELFFRISST